MLLLQMMVKKTVKSEDERIRKGVMNPRDPMENGTIGGTGPLNIDAACKTIKAVPC